MGKLIPLLGTCACAAILSAQAPPDSPGLKFTGFMQYRMEYTENPRVLAQDAGLSRDSDYGPAEGKNQSRTLVWLNVDNQFDGHTRFHAIISAEHLGGGTTVTDLQVKEGYVAAKFGASEVAVGRFMFDLGLGTLGGAPFMDGLHLSTGNALVKAQAYYVKFGNPGQFGDYAVADKSTFTYLAGDVKLTPAKGLTLSAAYFGETTTTDPAANVLGGALYKSWAAGFEYKYEANHIPYFTLSGEYADNSGAMAKKINGTTTPIAGVGNPMSPAVEGSDPKAYFVKAKVMGANPFMPGTGGLSVQYRKADAGFDAMGMASPFTWNAPFNWTSPAGGGIADNHKGIEIAAEVTILPRCIFKCAYGIMKLVNETSTLDVASPALAVVTSVTPTNGAPVVGTAFGTQNRTNQNYVTGQIFYIF